jgi:hypothetical protein
VFKIGEEIHRPTGPWTPTVHALLSHLQQRGFAYAPKALGFDGQGREVLSYIPGQTVGDSVPWPNWVWEEDMLAEVGTAAAQYHRAVADFRPAGMIPWHAGSAELGPDEIVCHHDIAPYNVVYEEGLLRGIIDWDLIGPGTIRSELAFIAWQWVPLQDPYVAQYFGYRGGADLGRRLRILLDNYGLDDRAGFIDDVIARVARNREVMRVKAEQGDAAYALLAQHGHIRGMDRAIEFLLNVGSELQAQLG